MRFKVKDFALLEGQLVEILRIRPNYSKMHADGNQIIDVKIKFHNDPIQCWVDMRELKTLACQKAAKVLFS